MTDPAHTPLHGLHLALGARMAPYAGYLLPLHYPAGIMAEHRHCRAAASLFDVSHMGQVELAPPAAAAAALERLTPADILGIPAGRQRYAVLMNEAGGIVDDMMVAHLPGRLQLVVNGARRGADMAVLEAGLGGTAMRPRFDRALLALQGPGAEAALASLAPEAAAMRFMDAAEMTVAGRPAVVTRSGYTGEDGYEIGLEAADAELVARALLAEPGVMPAGLGARDSLRLEAGLPLYGNDLDEATDPVEAALGFAVGKARRPGGARAGGYAGAARIEAALVAGTSRLRVGLRVEGRAPVRPPAVLYAAEDAAEPVGAVTSGGFAPSLDAPVAMGFVAPAFAAAGTRLFAEVRGRRLGVEVAALPFVPARFKR